MELYRGMGSFDSQHPAVQDASFAQDDKVAGEWSLSRWVPGRGAMEKPHPVAKDATRMGHPAERRALHTAVFFHAAIFGHLERVDVDGAGIGVDIGVQDDVMAFMAFNGVGIVDGPALAVFVGGEGFAVIADFADDVSALGGSHGGTAALAHVAHVVLSEKCSGCANQCGCKGKS